MVRSWVTHQEREGAHLKQPQTQVLQLHFLLLKNLRFL